MKTDITVRLRSASPEDAALILSFIKALAEYEKLSHAVEATQERIKAGLEKGYFEVLICEYGGEDAGFALYFHNFSTFVGKRGIYLEDIFVRPEFRGKGLGVSLFQKLGEIALERDCGRIEFSVLNWNEPSIRFYRSRGARPMDDWTTYCIDRSGIEALARESAKD